MLVQTGFIMSKTLKCDGEMLISLFSNIAGQKKLVNRRELMKKCILRIFFLSKKNDSSEI